MRNVEQNNRKIKILFPEQESYFSIELKGSEQSLKELLGAILKISSSSIKGLKDNYNNYYTLSSALKSKNINTTPHTFFSIITTGETNKINISQQGINNNDITLKIMEFLKQKLSHIAILLDIIVQMIIIILLIFYIIKNT